MEFEMKGTSIAGRKVASNFDRYYTPEWATRALLDRETFDGNVLEPACGSGKMVKVLREYGYEVNSFDIQDGTDFLLWNGEADNVVTNPPFSLGQEFVEKSLEVADKKVAMFLKLVFLESARRYKMFQTTPLRTVYVFSKRVQLYPDYMIEKPKNSGTIAYAWFVWDKGYRGKPNIEWIGT